MIGSIGCLSEISQWIGNCFLHPNQALHQFNRPTSFNMMNRINKEHLICPQKLKQSNSEKEVFSVLKQAVELASKNPLFLAYCTGSSDFCRIRKVKCDESKPNCLCCVNTGRICDYTSAARTVPNENQSRRQIINELPALPRFDNARQRYFFGFFVSYVSETSSVYFGANFWASRVLQLSLSEDSVRYALCALSALYQVSTSSFSATITETQTYALQQYSRAVECTRTLLSSSSDDLEKVIKGLVVCALFVCYETFTGNCHISHIHLRSGIQILAKEQ